MRLPDPFLLTSIHPKHTGLPHFVWIAVSPGGVQEPGLYISPGTAATLDDLIEVAIEPEVQVVGDVQISQIELDLIGRWIEVHRNAIIRHWNGEIDSVGLVAEVNRASDTRVS